MDKSYQLYKIEKLKVGSHRGCLYKIDEEHKPLISSFLRLRLDNDGKVLYRIFARPSKAVLDNLHDYGIDGELGKKLKCSFLLKLWRMEGGGLHF